MSKAEVVVVVDKLVPGGQGLCRDSEGVFFIDGVAAGDRIAISFSGKRRGVREARVLRVLEPSPDRAESADCPLVAVCGGCDWLHLSRAAQTRWKEQIVDDALVRVGRFAAADVAGFRRSLLVPPAGEGARRRARFVVDAAGRLAFFQRRSHERVTIPACPALDPRISATLSLLPNLKRSKHPRSVHLAVDDRGVVAGVDDDDDGDAIAPFVRGVLGVRGRVIGDPWLLGEVTSGAFPARSDALTFSQATRFGGAAIRDQVLRAAGDVDGGLGGAAVLELFAGSGHLSLPLASKGAVVDAVEGDERALSHLRHNASALQLPITARQAFIDEHLAVGSADVVVADPPRTGIPSAAALFGRFTSKRLVLVSCDPATGARDLRAAVAAGYVVDDVVPIDAFPRTHHVEWVASLSR